MKKPDILVTRTTRPDKLAELEHDFALHHLDQAKEPENFLDNCAELIRGIATTAGFDLRRELLDRLPNLEIIASFGVGYDKIEIDACTERGVIVTNTPDVLTDDVADIALGLLIALRRNLITGHDHVRSGAWGREGPLALTSALRGKRLGIVGLGRIGRGIANRAEPFGLQIGYTARSKRNESPYCYHATPKELAEWSDILVVAVPGGAGTNGIIDAETLNALGPTGSLVNVARGSVVDEAALIAALREGQIGNAALDVFNNEPHPDPALTGLPNVVLYPHHASGTVETRDRMAELVNDNLKAHFSGNEPLTPVNKVNR